MPKGVFYFVTAHPDVSQRIEERRIEKRMLFEEEGADNEKE